MTKEEKYIVFYTTIKSGMWPKIKGDNAVVTKGAINAKVKAFAIEITEIE